MKKVNPLLLLFLTVITFNTLNAQCELCETSLIQLRNRSVDLKEEKEELKDEVKRLRVGDNQEIAEKDALIAALNKEIEDLAQRVAELIAEINNMPIAIPTPIPTITPNDDTNAQLLRQIEVLEERVQELTIISNRVSRLESQITALNLEIAIRDTRISGLEESIKILENQVEILKQEKINLANIIATLEGKLNCIQTIEDERIYIEGIAKKELADADTAYKSLSNYGLVDKDTAGIKAINLIWDTYEEFGYNEVDTLCTEYRIRFQDDYKSCTNHYNSTRMIAYNEGNIINRFGDDLNEKIDNMNERLLYELGQAMKKCNSYDGLTDTNAILEDLENIQERLSELLIIERKANNDDELNTEITSNIDKIISLYNQEKFAESIMLYNKFQRLFRLEEFKFAEAKILEAKYCAGTILIWNLGNITAYEKIVLKGSWLNLILSKNTRKGVGYLLLKEVFEKTESIKLKKKAYTVRKKEFVSR